MNREFFEKLTAKMDKGEELPTLVGHVLGIKLFQSECMPDDMVICRDASGKIIGVIDSLKKKEKHDEE